MTKRVLQNVSRKTKSHYMTIHSKLYQKYVLINLCFILLPIALFLALYIHITDQQVSKDLRASNEYALRQTMRTVDASADTLDTFAYRLGTSNQISPYFLQRGNYSTIEALNQLEMYTSQFGFLENLYLSIDGDCTLYSGRGTTSFGTLFGRQDSTAPQVYRLEGAWTPEDLWSLFQEGEISTSLAENCQLLNARGERCFLLISPWKSTSFARIGSVIGVVNQRYFQELLNENTSEIVHGTFILDTNQNVIAQEANGLALAEEEIRALAALHLEGIQATDDFNLLFAQSDINGWLYMTVIPHGAMRTTTLAANRFLLTSIVMVTGILVAIGIWLAFQTYQPIRDLYERVSGEDASARRGEFEAIHAYITKIVNNNAQIRDQLEKSRKFETELLLQKIIAGNITPEKLEKEHQRIRLPHGNNAIAVLKTFERIEPLRREAVLFQPLGKIECVYATEMLYQDYVAILVNVRDAAHYQQMLQTIYESVSAACGCEIVIGAGGVCASMPELRHSLTEAIIAIEYDKIPRNEHIIHYSEVFSVQPTDYLSCIQSLQLKLIESMRQRDTSIAEATLDQLRSMAETEQDQMRNRYLVSSLTFCLMSAAQEVHMPQRQKKLEELERCENMDSFFYKAHMQCEEIIACYSRQMREKQLSLYDKILCYIEEHYTSSELSLSSIAEAFEITPSYLSRFFREAHGTTFIDYLTKKRMAEAKRLLESTDMKIQTILEAVGYLDIASFSRKFKQIYGISPGKYRENFQNNEE